MRRLADVNLDFGAAGAKVARLFQPGEYQLRIDSTRTIQSNQNILVVLDLIEMVKQHELSAMTNEIEHIRAALRGKRLQVLAAKLDVPTPALEQFVCGRASLAPKLLHGLSRILESSNPNPSRQQKHSCTRPEERHEVDRTRCEMTATLDPGGCDPGNSARVALEIAVGGRTFTADVAAKSVRKCRATIAEHGAEKCVLLIQGRLEGNAIAKAGIVVQVKMPRPEANERPDHHSHPTKENEMFNTTHDDELASICDDTEFKAKLGVGAEETLMIVVYLPEDGEPEDVAALIANRLKKPTAVIDIDTNETLAFVRPRSR